MEAFSEFLQASNIYFNFFSFANLLAFVFTFFLGVFMVTLPNRSKSTNQLGFAFLSLSPFNLAFVFAHSYYGPEAAYHRWVTVGMILVPFIHFAQWVLKYPQNDYKRTGWVFAGIQYFILFVAFALFLIITQTSGVVFSFTGHHWDFRADEFSKYFGGLILLYLFVVPAVATWRFFTIQTNERWTIVGIVGGILTASIIPAALNVMSRDGALPRGIFVTTFVIFTVAGYFLIAILYINRTSDRTTFMVKIVGISLVSFLLMIQAISLVTLEDREREYDALRVEYSERALENGKRNEDIEYIVKYSVNSGEIEKQYMSRSYELDLEGHREDLANSAIYEDLIRLEDVGYGEQVEAYMSGDRLHPFFVGYRTAILNYIEASELEDDDLAAGLKSELASINTTTRVNAIKINALNEPSFRGKLMKYLAGTGDDFKPFADQIERYARGNADLSGPELKRAVLRFVAPMKAEWSRHFRKTKDETAEDYNHFTAFTKYDVEEQSVYEVGYSYVNYRKYIHSSAFQQKIILIVVLVVLLVIFPLFFRGSLINPLNNLLAGVTKVNDGDLSVQVPIKVQDEIGFLAGSFNSMVVSIRQAQAELKDYANNLEEKVEERTAELNQTLQEVRALKTQQDGDYYLTSLLQKPLNYNANKSERIQTSFYLEQKKRFEFRNKPGDLGGDCCVTGNLRLGSDHDFRRYIVAANGDAMGKSMQGAGGSLVMGVVMNSILARSARNNRVMNVTPEQWLTDVYEEMQGVFQAFDGSMVISAVVAVIDEETGDTWYFNAEHPFSVLYRNGQASFVEEELQLRKIGLESELPFAVHYFKMEPNDVLVLGSDGRDDVDMTPDDPVRTINEDEYLFLKRVEESDGHLEPMVEAIKKTGVITDDLSLLRIEFHADVPAKKSGGGSSGRPAVIDIDLYDEEELDAAVATSSSETPAGSGDAESASGETIEERSEDFERLFQEGRRLARDGSHEEALGKLTQAYTLRSDVPALNKILAVLTFKERDYEKAIEILNQYLEHDPAIVDFWLYLSISHKRTGDYDRALEAGNRVLDISPDRVINLINLADIHQKLGNTTEARDFLDRALALDPQNRQARSLQSSIT
ncbi:MAG: SpoIIE family protein phosphatase [bacterium]|nr:SpoIIE family protein phosphatase [bacterium]